MSVEPNLYYIQEGLRPLAEPIDNILVNERNAWKHPAIQVAEIRGSLEEFGFDQPLVANRKSRFIVKGEGRYRAAKQLGYSHVPVVWVDDDDEQSIARALMDNLTRQKGEWDLGELDTQIREVADSINSVDAMLALDDALRLTSEDGQVDPVTGEFKMLPEEGTMIEDMELQPNESYDFILVGATNVQDWNRLCELLDIKDVYDGKRGNKRVGMARAIRASRLISLLDPDYKAE